MSNPLFIASNDDQKLTVRNLSAYKNAREFIPFLDNYRERSLIDIKRTFTPLWPGYSTAFLFRRRINELWLIADNQ